MNGQPSKEPRPSDRAQERARSQEEPGAHSGAESQARGRTVRGTASAREGYQAEGGTAHGEALEGVERQETEDRARER